MSRAALKLYETVRLPRTTQIQNGSWENKTRFHMPDGPGQEARDAAMAKGRPTGLTGRSPGFMPTTPAIWTPAPKAAQIPGH